MTRLIIVMGLCLLMAGPGWAEGELAKARAAMAAQEFASAADHFRQHLADSPDDGAAHYQLGVALMSSDQLEQAVTHFRRAGELGFQPLGVGYRLARVQARQGQAEAALEQLESVAKAGFGLPSLLENEPDFDRLRETSRFQAVLGQVQAARYPCKDSADHRAFDFWIGNWDVHYQGQQAGVNEVYPILGDCVIFENWTSASGSTGKSFNFHDRSTGQWRQIWIDDRGGVIEFTGQFENGELKYTAQTVAADGSAVMNRLTFTANADGSVRQYWVTSSDGGESWQQAFDGHYVRQQNSTTPE